MFQIVSTAFNHGRVLFESQLEDWFNLLETCFHLVTGLERLFLAPVEISFPVDLKSATLGIRDAGTRGWVTWFATTAWVCRCLRDYRHNDIEASSIGGGSSRHWNQRTVAACGRIATDLKRETQNLNSRSQKWLTVCIIQIRRVILSNLW